MSVQLIPAPLPELSRTRFAFEPPISGAGHNQWVLRRASWTELTATNTKSGREVTISRRWVVGIHFADTAEQPGINLAGTHPLDATVNLSQELELAAGRVVPLRRRVLEMPNPATRILTDKAELDRARRGEEWKAPIIAIRVESESSSRLRKLLKGSIAVGFVALIALVGFTRNAHFGEHLGLIASAQLPFTGADDYNDIVAEFGKPVSDQWIETDDGGYRRLGYTAKHLAVILAGETPSTAHYIGSVGRNGKFLHAPSQAAIEAREFLPLLK